MIVSAYYRCSGRSNRRQMSKSFFINLQICIDRPAKVCYNGRRRLCRLRFGTSLSHFGAGDFVLTLHFCTSAHGDIRHFITFALWRRACEIGDICPLISKATNVQIYVSKRLLTKLFHECSIVDKSVNSGDNSPSLKLPK